MTAAGGPAGATFAASGAELLLHAAAERAAGVQRRRAAAPRRALRARVRAVAVHPDVFVVDEQGDVYGNMTDFMTGDRPALCNLGDAEPRTALVPHIVAALEAVRSL